MKNVKVNERNELILGTPTYNGEMKEMKLTLEEFESITPFLLLDLDMEIEYDVRPSNDYTMERFTKMYIDCYKDGKYVIHKEHLLKIKEFIMIKYFKNGNQIRQCVLPQILALLEQAK